MIKNVCKIYKIDSRIINDTKVHYKNRKLNLKQQKKKNNNDIDENGGEIVHKATPTSKGS